MGQIKSIMIPTKTIRGKQRPRYTKQGHLFTPKETTIEEKLIKSAWLNKYGISTNDDVVCNIRLFIYQQLPKSAPKRRIGEWNVSKPDEDNVLKLVQDALNGVAYKDDAQVVSAVVQKCPRTVFGSGNFYVIEVEYLDDSDLSKYQEEAKQIYNVFTGDEKEFVNTLQPFNS